MKLKKNSKVRVAGLSSFFALLAVLGLAVFCPTSSDAVEAASRSQRLRIDFVLRQSLASQNLTIDFFLENGAVDWQKVAQVLGIDFVIAKNISLGMSDVGNVSINGTTQPMAEGKFVSDKTNFTVGTNSTAGLKVYVYGKDGKTAMATSDGLYNIPTLSQQVSQKDFEIDRWGYSLGVTGATVDSYNPVEASQKAAADFTGASNGSASLDLTFAAKVGYGVAPGDYSGAVNIHTVATAETTTALNELMDEVEELIKEAEANKQTNGGETTSTETE